MSAHLLGRGISFLAAALVLTGCSSLSDTVDKINPFTSAGPKMAVLTPITPAADARANWSADVGGAGRYVFIPAVVGRAVFVAGADGSIAKIENGATVWRIQAGQALSAGVGSDGRLVAVGTPKGEILAFSAADGHPLWQARVSSEVLAAPAVGEDGVAVRSGDNRIFLFDDAGQRKWVYQRATPSLSLRNWAPPLLADRYVFVGFPGGKLVALTVQNGAPAWEGTVALPKGATELDRVADLASPPLIDMGLICAAAFQGRVACFDLGQGGALVWARDISSASGIALDRRTLFITDDKGAVLALDRNTGASLWKQDKLLNRRVSAPLVQGDFVAVGDAEGVVHFLKRDDGSFAARVVTDGKPILAPPQALDASVLIQTTGGHVTAIEAR